MIGFYKVSIEKEPKISKSLDEIRVTFFASHKVRSVYQLTFKRLCLFQSRGDKDADMFDYYTYAKELHYGLYKLSNDIEWERMAFSAA